MGDRERDKGKQKISEYEGYGDSSQVSARRTRARLTSGPGGQNGAGINPSLAPLDPRDDRSRNWQRSQQRPAEQGGGEEGSSGALRTLDLISQMDRPLRLSDPEVMGSFLSLAPSSSARHQEIGGVGNPGTSTPPPCTGTPSSSLQMNFARNSTQAPSSSQAHHGVRGLQVQTRAPATAGQVGEATGASDSGQHNFRQIDWQCPRVPELMTTFVEALKLSVAQHQESGGVGNPGTLTSPLNFARDSMQAPSSSQAHHGRRGLQVQTQVPATAGQHGAATGASGSDQPQPNAWAVVHCDVCHNDLRGCNCPTHVIVQAVQRLLCDREPGPVNLAVDPHQRQPPPPPQQGQALPLAPAGEHEYLRCPGCRISKGLLMRHPRPHFCLCDPCRVSRVVCLICASVQARQPPRQGES